MKRVLALVLMSACTETIEVEGPQAASCVSWCDDEACYQECPGQDKTYTGPSWAVCRDAVLGECYCRGGEVGCSEEEIRDLHSACLEGEASTCWADFVDFETQSVSCEDGEVECGED